MAGDTWLNLVRDTVKFSCNVRSVQMTNSLIQEVLLSNPLSLQQKMQCKILNEEYAIYN